jgi:hypothetical protein
MFMDISYPIASAFAISGVSTATCAATERQPCVYRLSRPQGYEALDHAEPQVTS